MQHECYGELRRTCVISVQGFTEFRSVPESNGVAKFSARCVLGPFRQLVHRVSRNTDQKLFRGLVYKILQWGVRGCYCSQRQCSRRFKTCRSLDEVITCSPPLYLMLPSYLTGNFLLNTWCILQNLKEGTTDDCEESRAASWQFDVD